MGLGRIVWEKGRWSSCPSSLIFWLFLKISFFLIEFIFQYHQFFHLIQVWGWILVSWTHLENLPNFQIEKNRICISNVQWVQLPFLPHNWSSSSSIQTFPIQIEWMLDWWFLWEVQIREWRGGDERRWCDSRWWIRVENLQMGHQS